MLTQNTLHPVQFLLATSQAFDGHGCETTRRVCREITTEWLEVFLGHQHRNADRSHAKKNRCLLGIDGGRQPDQIEKSFVIWIHRL